MEVLVCLVPGVYVAYTDWTKRIIKNYITFPVIILGFIYALITKNPAGLWGFVFAIGILGFMYLKNGIGGGDVKLAGAFGVWFGFPNILYVLLIGSILSFIYGAITLARKGKWGKTMRPFLTSIWIKAAYNRSAPLHVNKLPDEGIHEDAVPYGTFLVIGAWVWFLFLFIKGGLI